MSLRLIVFEIWENATAARRSTTPTIKIITPTAHKQLHQRDPVNSKSSCNVNSKMNKTPCWSLSSVIKFNTAHKPGVDFNATSSSSRPDSRHCSVVCLQQTPY